MHKKLLKKSLPYIFIIGFAVFMFRGIFAPGFMSGNDNSFHYYDANYLVHTLIPQYHWISGWSMQGLAGYPVFVDYYQIGFLFIAFLHKAFSFSLNFSYKTAVLFSYILLGAGFYKVTGQRFNKIAALLITICLMLQKDIYCDRILGGIWNNYLALGIFFIFFHILDKKIKAMSVRNALILGLLLGLIILTHLYVAIFAFLLLFVYLVPYVIGTFKDKAVVKQTFIYALIPLVALAVSSYYLCGFIASREYFSEMYTKDIFTGLLWTAKSFFGPLTKAKGVLSTLILNIPVITRTVFFFTGLYIFFRKEKNPDIRRFLGCTAFFTLISLTFFSDIMPNLFIWWQRLPLIGTLQTNRFLVYAEIGMYIFAAYGLAKILQNFKKRNFALAACVIPVALAALFHYNYFAREASRTLEQSPVMPDVFKVWEWVDENIVSGRSRIVYQNTIGNIDDPILQRSDVFALSGVFTRVPQIGVSRPASPFPQEKYMRNDQGRIFGKPVKEVTGDYITDMMNNFNAEYIVTLEPILTRKLASAVLFRKERTFGHFSIFRLKDFKESWFGFRKDADYKTVEFGDQRLIFDIWNNSNDNDVFINVAYHPLWKASLNNRATDVKQGRYSLLNVRLPDKGFQRLRLVFDSFSPFWFTVSLSSLAVCVIIIVCEWVSPRMNFKKTDKTNNE